MAPCERLACLDANGSHASMRMARSARIRVCDPFGSGVASRSEQDLNPAKAGGLGGLPPSSVAERRGIVRGEENLKNNSLLNILLAKYSQGRFCLKAKADPLL